MRAPVNAAVMLGRLPLDDPDDAISRCPRYLSRAPARISPVKYLNGCDALAYQSGKTRHCLTVSRPDGRISIIERTTRDCRGHKTTGHLWTLHKSFSLLYGVPLLGLRVVFAWRLYEPVAIECENCPVVSCM